ncbi:MAG TPA: hypothetical protein ENI93_04480 [Gammaproteobacteria bacterium]|nr:hypothetical protein [Gammaproteobacteria bacterium]
MSDEIIITLEQLRGLIGLRMIHQGSLCRVIEVLEDGPSLVLQSIGESPTIQPNQHGEATRRSPVTYTIPVLNEEHTELSTDFLALDLVE